MKKLLKILVAVIVVIAAVLVGGRLWFRIPVSGYYNASEPAFKIPCLKDGFIPQGIDYVAKNNWMLLTGYMKDKSASPVYAVDLSSGEMVKSVTLITSDGKECNAHNGGVAEKDGLIYVCDSSADGLRVFKLSDLEKSDIGGTVTEIGKISLSAEGDHIGPAFVVDGPDGLIVGEFYIAEKYETPKSHYVGDNHAVAVRLPYSDGELGVSPTPDAAYSLPDLAQGMCFDDKGNMYISESWGASLSQIEVFDASKTDGDITLLGQKLPLTVLDENSRISYAKLAPMSEEIVIVDNKLYVNCESASKKYFFGILNGAGSVYKTDVKYFLGD